MIKVDMNLEGFKRMNAFDNCKSYRIHLSRFGVKWAHPNASVHFFGSLTPRIAVRFLTDSFPLPFKAYVKFPNALFQLSIFFCPTTPLAKYTAQN